MSMSFIPMVNPNGGVVYRRVMEESFSKNQLLERIFSTENISTAWKRVRAQRKCPWGTLIKVHLESTI